MKRIEIKVGERYERLVILGEAPTKGKQRQVFCKCDCGAKTIVALGAFRHGDIKSCGCLRREVTAKRSTKHGHNKRGYLSRIYTIWRHMKERCLNKKVRPYKHYGGRGITVCKEWLDFIPFYEWAMPNGYKDNLTIERIDNDLGYSPDNCTWIPLIDQAQNTRNSIPVKVNGMQFATISAAARNFNIKPGTAIYRLANGWGADQTFSTPVRKRAINA